MDDDFSAFTVPQLRNHCAANSLSYCLYLLGIEASQRDLAHAAGVPWRVYRDGLDETETRRAANAYGVTAKFVLEADKTRGPGFAARLRRHLQQGHPAMLLVWDFGHWISVLGYADDRFIIADPDDDDRAFSRWTARTLLQNCWNLDDDEPDQYFAILLKRRDGKPTRWKLTDDWLRLVERGSEEKLSELADDIAEVARRAGGVLRDGRSGVPLAAVLKEHEDVVCREVAHWVEADVSLADLRGLYRDFRISAESLRLRVPRDSDRQSIIAQMATLLCTWVWAGEL